MSLNCFRELKRKIEFLSIAKKVMLFVRVTTFYNENELPSLLENVGCMGTVKIVSGNSNKTSFEYDIKKGDVDK